MTFHSTLFFQRTRRRGCFLWLLTFFVGAGAGAAEQISVRNRALEATFSSGYLSLTSRNGQRTFFKNARLSQSGGVAMVANVVDQRFGTGEALEVTYEDGGKDSVMLFSRLPFALVRSSINNTGTQAMVKRSVETFSGDFDLGAPSTRLKTFGTGGLHAPSDNPGSYAWLAVVEPQSRNGVVLGWLTHDRGSGVLFTKTATDRVTVDARLDYGRLQIEPGEAEPLEALAIGYFDDARLGLEAWAEAVAKWYDIRLPAQPAGYCTWYSQPHGGASDEKHLAELSGFAAKELAPFGFSVIQIDDKWQAGVSTNGPKRNFTTHNPSGPYPCGMKAAADNIRSLGLVSGIWFMPFAGTYYDPFFSDKQDWFAQGADGRPYETAWGGTCLDMTHPKARDHLRDLVRRIAHEWGYQYFKLDGLWTGTATRQQYVNSGYKEDGMGDAKLHDPKKTHIEAYRDGLRLVRDAAGPKVFILGCNGPQNMRSYGGAFGLVDAMRIGPDNKSEWKSLLRGPTFGSRHYFLHGRIWYNDPDPVYVRASMPLNHAQLICSWVAISGQLNLSSEWLPGLPEERLDLLKRTLPNHGLLPRPVDLFEKEVPSLWLLTDTRRSPRRDVIGIFNWEAAEEQMEFRLERFGLDPKVDYVAYDYWENNLLNITKGQLQVDVPGQSCRVLSIRPRAAHPQLISTSRHVTQGMVDVFEERWDQQTGRLRGRSQVVARDAYELRIVSSMPALGVELSAADLKLGVKATINQTPKLVRVVIQSPSSREVLWSVRFK